MTKSEYRTMIRQLIDDPNAVQWSNDNLDLLIALVMDQEWADAIGVQPWLLSQLDVIAATDLDTPGFVSLCQTPNGDLSQRFFRLQTVVRDGTQYTSTDPRFVTIENNEVLDGPNGQFYINGDQLWLFPLNVDSSVEVRYNFRPARFDDLADGDEVPWPDGHEGVVIYQTAVNALAKGAREDPAIFIALAREARIEMMGAISRNVTEPMMPFIASDTWEWGSV